MLEREVLNKISDLIARETGLSFFNSKNSDLERILESSYASLGFKDISDFAGHLISLTHLTAKYKTILNPLLTVGETYFFREKPAVQLFAKTIIPELIEISVKEKRKIRIWSAGCSSGEEPYTLVMLLKENFPWVNPDDLEILATDINENSINKAKNGIYSDWSFRGIDNNLIKKYFTRTGTKYIISDKIKEMVKFKIHNLSKDSYLFDETKRNKWDIILCRNVLMYFTPEIIKYCAQNFHASLNEGGWFITSQVELNDEYFSIFQKISDSGGIFYRKCSDYKQHKNPVQQKDILQRERPSVIRVNVVKKADTSHIQKKPEPSATIKRTPDAKEMANTGNYKKAIEIIEHKIENKSAVFEDFLLFAEILTEQEKLDEAKNALRKCLYLNPDHLQCHFMMGNILKRQGDSAGAVKYFRNALELLDEPGGAGEPQTGGIEPQRFRQILLQLTEEKNI